MRAIVGTTMTTLEKLPVSISAVDERALPEAGRCAKNDVPAEKQQAEYLGLDAVENLLTFDADLCSVFDVPCMTRDGAVLWRWRP